MAPSISTASAPKAAALRKIPPTLSWFVRPTRPTTTPCSGSPKKVGRVGHGRPPAYGQHAAMDGEPNDGVHDQAPRHIDGCCVGNACEQVGEDLDPVLGEKAATRHRSASAEEEPQHDFTLGDEALLPPDEIALANRAIGFDSRIAGIVNRDEHRALLHESACGKQEGRSIRRPDRHARPKPRPSGRGSPSGDPRGCRDTTCRAPLPAIVPRCVVACPIDPLPRRARQNGAEGHAPRSGPRRRRLPN